MSPKAEEYMHIPVGPTELQKMVLVPLKAGLEGKMRVRRTVGSRRGFRPITQSKTFFWKALYAKWSDNSSDASQRIQQTLDGATPCDPAVGERTGG